MSKRNLTPPDVVTGPGEFDRLDWEWTEPKEMATAIWQGKAGEWTLQVDREDSPIHFMAKAGMEPSFDARHAVPSQAVCARIILSRHGIPDVSWDVGFIDAAYDWSCGDVIRDDGRSLRHDDWYHDGYVMAMMRAAWSLAFAVDEALAKSEAKP